MIRVRVGDFKIGEEEKQAINEVLDSGRISEGQKVREFEREYWMVRNYRDGYDIFASNGILFNHESPRRGETFVTRKITRAIAAILTKKQNMLYLGNLSAKRD